MLADEDETTKEREGIEGQPEEEDIVPEISLHAIMGTETPQTMRVRRSIGQAEHHLLARFGQHTQLSQY